MTPTKQQLIDAIKDVSFEMNRYLYAANPVFPLPGRYRELVAESCLMHSRVIGEFFFEGKNKDDDIRVLDYYDILVSSKELKYEIEKYKPKWQSYKSRVNKKLGHLTFTRVNTTPMNMEEIKELNFDVLIRLFEDNLPIEFKDGWMKGKSYSI